MTNLVPAEDIERIVGTTRRHNVHCARAVSSEQTVYILHSQQCKDSGIDLRECRYSLALDQGIDTDCWADHQDMPVLVLVWRGRLVPCGEIA